MRKIKKSMIYLAVCMAFVMNMAMTAGAATDEDDEEITKVTLTVTAEVTADGVSGLDVTADSSRYRVESFDFAGGSGSWEPGDIPKVKVVLTAADAYSFSSRMAANRVTVKTSGTCTGVRRLDKGASLEVTVTLKAIPGTLGTIDDAYWVDVPLGKARWDEAKKASAYQVKLYYKNSVIKTVDKTTVNYYDFHSYMTKVGTYYFKVRAIPRNSSESTYMDTGEWVNSDDLYIESGKTASQTGQSDNNGNQYSPGGSPGASPGNSPGVTPAAGGTDISNAGWISDNKGWRYRDNGGAYVTNDWSYIDNKWYLFDMAGYMETGWVVKNYKYYFLTVNGDMATGWVEHNKRWYFLGSDGAMLTGWIQSGDQWYYANADGTRASGWTSINQRWYYFSPDTGLMMRNTVIDGRQVNGDGVWIQQ